MNSVRGKAFEGVDVAEGFKCGHRVSATDEVSQRERIVESIDSFIVAVDSN